MRMNLKSEKIEQLADKVTKYIYFVLYLSTMWKYLYFS